MELAAFYHCYVDGEWREPLDEFVDALGDFPHPLYFGFVGAAELVDEARAHLREPLVVKRGLPWSWLWENAGFEDVTLKMVREYAQEHDGAVMYAHSKGSSSLSEHNRRWRQRMTDVLVKDWRVNLELLEHGLDDKRFDAVGPYWMTAWPAAESRFFGGNFWMATCEWLRSLPLPEVVHRYQAEEWIGNQGGRAPRVHNLIAQIPDPTIFGLPQP